MKHLLYNGKSLLAGDDVVDLLLEYASLMPGEHRGDAVTIRAIGPDGNEVMVTFLLNAGTELVAESTTSDLPDPENEGVVAELRRGIDAIRTPPPVVAEPRPVGSPGAWEEI